MTRRFAWPLIYVLFFGLCSWRIGGDGTPDNRSYHVYNGYAAVTDGRPQDIAAAGLQSYFYPGLDALYHRLIWAMNDHPVRLEFLLGLPYALAAWLVLCIGHRTLPRDWPGRQAFAGAFALFGLTGAAGFAAIGTAMSDVVPSLPLLAGLALWLRNRRNLACLAAAGALAGLSVGLKLTALPLYIGFFVAVTVGEARHPAAALRAALVFGATGIVAALGVVGPWLLHNWQAYGNPIFPNFNDLFHSDLVAYVRWSDDRFRPHGVWRQLLYPAFWAFRDSQDAVELTMHDPRMLIALVAIAALLAQRGANTEARLLALFAVIAYALWEYQFSIYRYLTALECLSGVLALAALAAWVPRRFAGPAGLVLVALAGVAAATTKYPWWDRSAPGKQVISVDLPPIPANALVILADPSEITYTVPFLPPGVTVVGANNNLTRPGAPGTLQQKIERTIRDWHGPIWSFENGHYFPGAADATLTFYGLRRVTPCAEITSNIEVAHGTCLRTASAAMNRDTGRSTCRVPSASAAATWRPGWTHAMRRLPRPFR